MSRPVVRAGIAALGLSTLTVLCVQAGAALLPAEHAVWLIKPLLGIDVSALEPGYLGFGTGDVAVSIAVGGIGIVASALYLEHCVINQPMWSVIGGWGLLISGFLTMTLQEIVNPGRTMFIDIDHLLWPVGLAPAVVGVAVIGVSWWRAPEFFAPHESRWALIVWVAAVAIADWSARLAGLSYTIKLAVYFVITLVVLMAGSWVTERLVSMRAGPPPSSELT